MKLTEDVKIDKGVLALEKKIGIRENYFKGIFDEDDWSFVIKLHAIFEAACTHLLLFHFKEPELNEIFSRLELSNKSTGKLAFLAKLELLEKENRRFISTLSELRNSLVHDVRNSEFSLERMVGDLSSSELKNFAVSFSPLETVIREFKYDKKAKVGYDEEWQKQASMDAVLKRASSAPKFHIWFGAYNVLISIVNMYDYSEYKQWVKANDLFSDGPDA